MKYYRLIFKKDESGQCVFTEVLEQEMSNEDFEKMNWEKPIIKHVDNEHVHFVALERTYLEAMLLGIQFFRDLDGGT